LLKRSSVAQAFFLDERTGGNHARTARDVIKGGHMFRMIPAAVTFAVTTAVAVPTATQPQQPPTTSVADTEYGTEILLLERIQKVLDEAADGQTGTVKMERGMIDELRSEVTQVRLALKARTVRGS
jgi:hypothetical protein